MSDQREAQDKLPYCVYLLAVLSYLILCTMGAILINDLTLIFGIIAGLAECSTVFILPSIFYLKACKMVSGKGEQGQAGAGGGWLTIIGAYVYLLFGIFYFCVSNYFNFSKMLR